MTKNKDTALVQVGRITSSILILRGHRVIIDRDLAAIYGVSTGRLNEAVKRNAERFPADFMFRLTRKEAELSRSQIAILKSGRGYNVKFLPYAFIEHGAIPAANILISPRGDDGHPAWASANGWVSRFVALVSAVRERATRYGQHFSRGEIRKSLSLREILYLTVGCDQQGCMVVRRTVLVVRPDDPELVRGIKPNCVLCVSPAR